MAEVNNEKIIFPNIKKIVALALLIATLGVGHAQTLHLPDSIQLSPKQKKELFTYFDKAPLLEKFFLMTMVPQKELIAGRHYPNYGGWFEYDTDYVMTELHNLKELSIKKQIPHWSYLVEPYKIDYVNGYIRSFVGNRILTYWKYEGDKYIIATNFYEFWSEIEGDTYYEPLFYRYSNDTLTQVNIWDVVRPRTNSYPCDRPEIAWYDLFTPEEHFKHEVRGNLFCWVYILPEKGKDIIVSSPSGESGGLAITDFKARYKWNGDGTFTKIGRNQQLVDSIGSQY